MIQNDIASIRKALNYSTVFKQMKIFIDQYNAGETDIKKRLNSNVTATAEKITALYLKQLHKAISLGDRFEEGLPGFHTYNPSLATYRNCTCKTIMNHKKRLKAAGFIIEEVNHGKSGVELVINTSIFSLRAAPNQPETSLKTENTAPSFVSQIGKNLHPLYLEQKELNNNTNSDVDNSCVMKGVSHPANPSLVISDSGTPQEQPRTSWNTVKSDDIKNSSPKEIKEKPRENFKNTVGSDEETAVVTTTNGNTADSSKKEKAKANRARNYFKKEIPVFKDPSQTFIDRAYKMGLLEHFWFYAKGILYADLSFSAEEELKIKKLIWESVFFKFKFDATEKKAQKITKELQRRVDMVSNWRARKPNHRWIPLPEIYFNINNKRNGFDKTLEWIKSARRSRQYVALKLKKEQKTQKILDQVKKEWSDYELSIGKHTDKTRFQLYEIQQKRIAAKNDLKLNQLFEDILTHTLKTRRYYAKR